MRMREMPDVQGEAQEIVASSCTGCVFSCAGIPAHAAPHYALQHGHTAESSSVLLWFVLVGIPALGPVRSQIQTPGTHSPSNTRVDSAQDATEWPPVGSYLVSTHRKGTGMPVSQVEGTVRHKISACCLGWRTV